MTTQNHAKAIFNAAQTYLAYLNYDHNLDCYDEDYNEELALSDGFGEEEDFKDAVKAAIEALGFAFTCDYDAQSSYYDLYSEEDEDMEESLGTLRVSNHKQTRGGTEWSIEAQDSIEMIKVGLDKIAKLKK